MIRLTLDEWQIVKEQCRDCIYWSDVSGCTVPQASFPEPVKHCFSKRTEGVESEPFLSGLAKLCEKLIGETCDSECPHCYYMLNLPDAEQIENWLMGEK